MNARKFCAPTTREALRLVKDALGPDAIILANRPVAGGVEITAATEGEVAAAQRSAVAAPAPAPESRPTAAPADDSFRHEMMKEMRELRRLVEGQLAGLAWRDWQEREPGKVYLLRALLAAGFGADLCRELADALPAGSDFEKGMAAVKENLRQRLPILDPADDPVEAGGVFALVGPTGVGKTTTVAKLAARCTVRHGPNAVALVTTDTYRIGAVDQLRIYGNILGVPVVAVKDEVDLQLTLADLQGRRLVLVDTIGMSQRDRRLAEQAALLSRSGGVKRLLLLSTVSHGRTLDDVARCYGAAGLVGCILTKIDEARSLGAALDVAARHGLPVGFVTNGQRVPEDLHPADVEYLLERALRLGAEDSAFSPLDDEFPLLASGTGRKPAGE